MTQNRSNNWPDRFEIFSRRNFLYFKMLGVYDSMHGRRKKYVLRGMFYGFTSISAQNNNSKQRCVFFLVVPIVFLAFSGIFSALFRANFRIFTSHYPQPSSMHKTQD